MRSTLFGLTATLVSAACIAINPKPSAVDPASGEVAFDLRGPGGAALVVPVRVNGEGPFPFVLDTGATLTCVDESLAKELQLPEAAGTVAFGGGVRGMSSMRLVEIESVELGSAKATGVKGCVVDLQVMQKAGVDIKGLLGLNVLKAYRVTIDFKAGTVRLQPPGDEAETSESRER